MNGSQIGAHKVLVHIPARSPCQELFVRDGDVTCRAGNVQAHGLIRGFHLFRGRWKNVQGSKFKCAPAQKPRNEMAGNRKKKQ